MPAEPLSGSNAEAEELRRYFRTIAETEWLLIALLLLYQLTRVDQQPHWHVISGLCLYALFVMGLRYCEQYLPESPWKLAIETWSMIMLITFVLHYLGGLDSPLLYLYLLPVIASALALGRIVTLLQVALIAACFVLLSSSPMPLELSLTYVANILTRFAPVVLVAYFTTMLCTDLREALEHIKKISASDELTGIFNIRAFNAIAERIHRQAVRYDQFYSIAMLDTDHLKKVNDIHGHEAGSRLIQLAVRCAQRELRKTDILARYGGDEFILLLPHTRPQDARNVAERIRQAIEKAPLQIDGGNASTTISIGIAGYPEHGDDVNEVTKCADRALYESKEKGRNRVTVQTQARRERTNPFVSIFRRSSIVDDKN